MEYTKLDVFGNFPGPILNDCLLEEGFLARFHNNKKKNYNYNNSNNYNNNNLRERV